MTARVYIMTKAFAVWPDYEKWRNLHLCAKIFNIQYNKYLFV